MATVRRFAERQPWPLRQLGARLTMEEREGRIVSIDIALEVDADLAPDRYRRLLEAARTCRISRAVGGAVLVSLR